MEAPTRRDAMAVAIRTFDQPIKSCSRFATGLRNYVFDVELASGQAIVVRFGRPEARREVAGGLFWHDRLAQVGVPVAKVLAANPDAKIPYLILDRLPGTDLGNVFERLTHHQLGNISESVAVMQRQAGQLQLAAGYGYAFDYTTPLATTWHEVLYAQIQRSQQRIEATGLVDSAWVQRVDQALADFDEPFDDVVQRPFLHDVTTKNVIIHNGMVSGIVDVDEMCFGDPLWTASLTRMSLLAARRSTAYIDPQVAALDPTNRLERRFDLYTSLHCLGFLAELGQQFNSDTPVPVTTAYQQRLETILATLLASI